MLAQRQLTAEQRVQKAIVDILYNPKCAWLAGLIMVGERKVLDAIPPHNTAATNGRDEYYCRAFVDGLTDAELRGLILHEVWHKLKRHMSVYEYLMKLDARRANRAMDYVNNLEIRDEFGDWAKIPEGGCIDEKFRGMSEVEVFNALKQDGGGGGGGGQGEPGEGEPGEGESLDHHDWEGAQEMTQGEKEELAREIDRAIRQGSMMASKTGNSDSPIDLAKLLQPKVDWRRVLREFVSSTCKGRDLSTYRRFRRRTIGQDLYLPSTYSETVGELVLAVDTSGSMSDAEIHRALSEVKGICDLVKPERVRLLYWDGAVERDEVYEQGQLDGLEKSTRPMGGGGTDVRCVTQYMRDKKIKPQAVVVFTDGYLPDWSTWPCPVLWCITNNQNARPTTGKVLHVKTSEM